MENSSNIIEQQMEILGVLPSNPLQPTNFQPDPTASCSSANLVNPKGKLSSTSFQLPPTNCLLQSTKNQLDSTVSSSSDKRVNSQVQSSANLVNSSNSSCQLQSTKKQLQSTNIHYLSELGQQAKGDLEVLVATGKTKDFLGKFLTFNDLDYMSEKDLLKYHRIYQSALSARVNDTFGKIAVKTYVKVASRLLPINDEDKLYHDLRNDYVLVNEIEKWTGWLSLKMGGLMAVATTSLITLGHCEMSRSEMSQKSHIINDAESRGDNSSD